jgi:hypothetical protein
MLVWSMRWLEPMKNNGASDLIEDCYSSVVGQWERLSLSLATIVSEFKGISMMKTVPLFNSEITLMVPPIKETSLFEIQRPNPVPPYLV